jgi:hypothetical protein
VKKVNDSLHFVMGKSPLLAKLDQLTIKIAINSIEMIKAD